ncbi:hypothetical protein [Deinococcus sp. PESE-13]
MTRVDDVRAGLLNQITNVITTLYPAAKQDGSTYRLGSLDGEEGSSLSIEVKNDARKGAWIDFATNEKGGIFELIQAARGTDFQGALLWATEFLGLPPVIRSIPKPLTREGKQIGIANLHALGSNERRLEQNEKALAYLQGQKRGLRPDTIKHFRLGLSSYTDKSGKVIYKDALTYPQLDSEGQARSRWLKSFIPDVTERPEDHKTKKTKDWASGAPSTYWLTPAKGRRDLLICEGAKDGWKLWQELQGTPLATSLCIITSTHGSVIPDEWQNPSFWSSWNKIYAGQDADDSGDDMARKVREHASKEVLRLRVPEQFGKDWGEFFGNGGTVIDLQQLLEAALPVTQKLAEAPVEGVVPVEAGYYHIEPVDLSKAYVNGFLYYPFRALEVENSEGQRLQRWRDLVLRSDGTICKAAYLPHAPGTPKEDRILALDDGTILTKMPVANPVWSTFKTDAINEFATCRKEGRSALTMTPGRIVEAIEQHLRSKTVLPYDHDYAMLTYVVVTSYVQAIFEAVPLLLIVGVAGSGKSELGAALAQLSCNGIVLNGQTSAASVARIMDSVGGLAVIDDLEGIGANTKNSGEFSDLIQQLKVSYKKATARKVWTNTQTMKVEELNFYGIKVINNTEGVDGILGTRMLKVYTRKINPKYLTDAERPEPLSPEQQKALRTNLHIWAMENAQKIAELYEQKYSRHTARQEEITAPLRLLAELMDHQPSARQLALALQSQEKAPEQIDSSVDLLIMAVKELIRQGYREYVTMPQLELEMQRIVGGNVWGQSNTTEIAEWQEPRWVGRQLRNALIVNPHAEEGRPRLWGQQIRLNPLSADFVAEVLNEFDAEGVAYPAESLRPLAFCEQVECRACPYSDFCKLQARKAKHLQKSRAHGVALN